MENDREHLQSWIAFNKMQNKVDKDESEVTERRLNERSYLPATREYTLSSHLRKKERVCFEKSENELMG